MNKNLLKGLALLVFVALIVGGFFYLNWDIKRVWDDEKTWDKSSVVSIDEKNPNIEISRDENGNVDYNIGYALLTKIEKKDNQIVYSFSYLPYYLSFIAKAGFKDFSLLTPDITLVYTPGTDPLPSSYLDLKPASADEINSFGDYNTPVVLKLSVSESMPKATLSNKLSHYLGNMINRKQSVISKKLTKWEIDKQVLSTTNDEMATWAKETYDDFMFRIDIDSFRQLTGYNLLNALRDEMAYQNFYCRFDEMLCAHATDENPASNIMLMLYTMNNNHDKFVDSFLKVAREKVSPFALAYDKNFKEKDAVCEDGKGCTVDYQDMQAYTFPVSPVREILNGSFKGANVDLFKEYMKSFATTKTGALLYTKKQVGDELNKLIAKQYKVIPEVNAMDPKDVVQLDTLAYHMIVYSMNDKESLGLFEKAYVHVLSSHYGVISDVGQPIAISSMNDFKTIVARSYQQFGEENYAADERLAFWQITNGIDDRSTIIRGKRHTASVPLTLMLVYLYQ